MDVDGILKSRTCFNECYWSRAEFRWDRSQIDASLKMPQWNEWMMEARNNQDRKVLHDISCEWRIN